MMIPRFFQLLIGFALFISCTPEQVPSTYSVSGNVINAKPGDLVILTTFDPITQVKTGVDTSSLDADGNYALNFEFKEPDLFRVDFPSKQYFMLAIDEGQDHITLNITGPDKGQVEITGSEDSQKLLDYDAFRAESNNRLVKVAYDAMKVATDAGDEAAEVEAVLAYAQNNMAHRRELIAFTEENIGTSIALYGTVLRWTGDDQVEKLDQLVRAFAKVHPDLKMTAAMEAKVDRYKKVAIGAVAPDIVQPNQNGKSTSLYQSKGTYTLIDFWASWCGPCILQIPDLKEAKEKFGPLGFEIFSVSADTKGDRWKAAINEHQLDWPNVSDLKGWESEAANAYNVTFLPFNLLIDSEGKIVAKNLHSKALQNKLTELFTASN
ncbi:MAG: AhpC/TSA family protein [Saprospiraceae bacterium]|nr:AhpC/TSA family protein [Saprospiraceae bacterium]